MTTEDIEERLEAIREEASEYDDEGAHSREDRLYIDLLAAIADGSCVDPKACAELALKARAIDFARWCA